MPGRAIRIFLVDGKPRGLRTAEIGLSTVKALICPRSNLAALKKRPESRRTGVYVLVGEDPNTPGRNAIYVGEGDDVFQRILQHDKDETKGFWDEVVLFVSKDENLTKSHVRHLEARLIELAQKARRATLVNGNAPAGGTLPEADQAEMNEFLEQSRLLLATFGVTAFEPASERAVVATETTLRLTMSGKGYAGSARYDEGTFVVESGSAARVKEAESLSPSSRALRQELLASGVLEQRPDALMFTQDYEFSSASGSAQVICGANVNGKITWRLEGGETFKDWEDAELSSDESPEDS